MGIALITGASAGLGTEFAKLFAQNGHSVVLVARRKDRLQELAGDLVRKNPSVKTWILDMDLSQAHAGKILFDRVQALGLEVDFLVNNAAFGSGGPFADLALDRELQIMDLNMRTLVETTRLFLPSMIRRKSGRILNVGSLAGFQPGPFMNTYSASKAFVNSFSEGLHEELRGTGVTCTVLAPGLIATEFQEVARLRGNIFQRQRNATSANPAFVARKGYLTMMRGQALRVPGFLNSLGAFGVRLAPRSLLRRMVASLNRSQIS